MKIRSQLVLILIFFMLLIGFFAATTYSLVTSINQHRKNLLNSEHKQKIAMEFRAELRQQMLITYKILLKIKTLDERKEINEASQKTEKSYLEFIESIKKDPRLLNKNEKTNRAILLSNIEKSYLNFKTQYLKIINAVKNNNLTYAQKKIRQFQENEFDKIVAIVSTIRDQENIFLINESQKLGKTLDYTHDFLKFFITLIGLFTLAMLVYIPYNLNRRFSILEDSIARFGAGDCTIQIEDTGKDEFSALAKEFNKMAHSICKANGQIKEQEEAIAHSAKMSYLGSIAGKMAHEINTPLAIILSKVECTEDKIAKNKASIDDILDALSMIKFTTSRINDVLKNMRFFTQDFNKKETSRSFAYQIIEGALTLTHDKLNRANVNLKVIKDIHYTDLSIDCRADEISQVLMRLIYNASDAIDSLAEKNIWLEVKDAKEYVEFAVIDSGKIDNPEIIERMMLPFYSTKELGKGLGLGLSVCKNIIDSHHGIFYIDKKYPKTKFVIKLLKKQPSNEQAPEVMYG